MVRRTLQTAVGLCAVLLVAFAGWWVVTSRRAEVADAETAGKPGAPAADPGTAPVKLSKQAQKNLALVTKPLKATSYWRTIELPGLIEDRPGISDRGVVAPITGIITKIHAYPGSAIPPNEPLFSIRLTSESLHASQLELFKATKEIEIARKQYERLEGVAQSGAVPQSRLIEIQNQIDRLDVSVQASVHGSPDNGRLGSTSPPVEDSGDCRGVHAGGRS